jgi:hypothetical protein
MFVHVQGKIEDLLRRRNEMLEQDGAGAGGADGTGADSGAGGGDYEARIADAHRKLDATRKKFEKLRTVCISAEQVRAPNSAVRIPFRGGKSGANSTCRVRSLPMCLDPLPRCMHARVSVPL